jgi:hypothetical protein
MRLVSLLVMRFSGRGRAWLLAMMLAGLPAAPVPAVAAERVEVPLHQRVLSDGNIRYFVTLSVAGSRPLDAMLDTGSTGLRMPARCRISCSRPFATISGTWSG